MMSDVGRKVLYYLESLKSHFLVIGFEPGVLGVLAGKDGHVCYIICTMACEIL